MSERGQVNTQAAEVYETFFLPALFAEWAPKVADAAAIGPGQRVLDVACGTGVLAREAARRVRPGGAVVGLDINPGMLAVAARHGDEIELCNAPAEALPYPEQSFDCVVCQFGLMFFEDRMAAAREMLRVLRPDGRIAVAVWARIEESPGYAAMADLLQRLFGQEVAAALHAPFCMGDASQLRALFADAGADVRTVETLPGTAGFDSVDAWVHTDVKGWTLADMIDDDQYETLRRAAPEALARFVADDGSVRFDAPAHILTAMRP